MKLKFCLILHRLALGVVTVFFLGTATAAERQPNIVLIDADDLGFGDVGSPHIP